MNYRHCYHAGNFADVIKHLTLILSLQSMQKKEAPFCFIDTHAGIGLYHLQEKTTQKKCEYKNGISKLISSDIAELQDYLSIIKKYNPDNQLVYYPGSPLIAKEFLRPQDQMILCELHPEDYQTLKKNCAQKNLIAVHHLDGYQGLRAFLPPKQKRGLVLIDPPFEKEDEFDTIFLALKHALTHWRSGHFIIWYPIKDALKIKKFIHQLASITDNYHVLNFSVTPQSLSSSGGSPSAGETRMAQRSPSQASYRKRGDLLHKLTSCGIVLINPPWLVKEKLMSLIPHLHAILSA